VYWLAETQGERLSNHVFCNRFLGSLQAIAPLHTGSVYGYVSVASALCGLSVAVLASRFTVHSAVGCFGWLDRRGYAGA
jgi:hypothetical protein